MQQEQSILINNTSLIFDFRIINLPVTFLYEQHDISRDWRKRNVTFCSYNNSDENIIIQRSLCIEKRDKCAVFLGHSRIVVRSKFSTRRQARTQMSGQVLIILSINHRTDERLNEKSTVVRIANDFESSLKDKSMTRIVEKRCTFSEPFEANSVRLTGRLNKRPFKFRNHRALAVRRRVLPSVTNW